MNTLEDEMVEVEQGQEVRYRVGGTDAEPELRRAMVTRVNDSEGQVNLQIEAKVGDEVFNEVEQERGFAHRPRVQKGDAVGQWR